MSASSRPPDVAVSVDVPRPPDQVWSAVADPRRIAAWSPEAQEVSGVSGDPGPIERTMRETLDALAVELGEA